MCARYEVFLIKPVARRTVHRLRVQDAGRRTPTTDNSLLHRLISAKWANNKLQLLSRLTGLHSHLAGCHGDLFWTFGHRRVNTSLDLANWITQNFFQSKNVFQADCFIPGQVHFIWCYDLCTSLPKKSVVLSEPIPSFMCHKKFMSFMPRSNLAIAIAMSLFLWCLASLHVKSTMEIDGTHFVSDAAITHKIAQGEQNFKSSYNEATLHDPLLHCPQQNCHFAVPIISLRLPCRPTIHWHKLH